MIDLSNGEQRTEAWWQARCGRVTASRIADVITTTRNGWGHARAKYADQLVAERLTRRPQDMRRIRSLDDRADLEHEAIAAYEFYVGESVKRVGFIQHPDIEMAGSSPDGVVGRKGGMEIKVYDAAQHAKLLEGNLNPMEDYLPQIMFNMATTKRTWWDFVAYCPTMPEEFKLFTKRIDRAKDVIEKIESTVIEFLAEVDVRVQAIRSNGRR